MMTFDAGTLAPEQLVPITATTCGSAMIRVEPVCPPSELQPSSSLKAKLDGMAQDLALVGDGDLGRPHLVGAEAGRLTADRLQRRDLDGVARGDLDRA